MKCGAASAAAARAQSLAAVERGDDVLAEAVRREIDAAAVKQRDGRIELLGGRAADDRFGHVGTRLACGELQQHGQQQVGEVLAWTGQRDPQRDLHHVVAILVNGEASELVGAARDERGRHAACVDVVARRLGKDLLDGASWRACGRE